jgi:hypothetical protein
MQQLIRAINGTLQTRVPRISTDNYEVKTNDVLKEKIFLNYFLESIGLCF